MIFGWRTIPRAATLPPAVHFSPVRPVIETPRLRLRPFAPADASQVQRLAGAREVADTTATVPHPYSDGVAEQWIATHAREWTEHRQLICAITFRATDEFIGACGLVFDPLHDKAELGYWIGVPFWNLGLATEAAGGLVDYGFRVIGLNRIQAHHLARNPASGRVMLKLGMKREGASPRAMKKNNRFEDVVFYGILRRDWPGLRDSTAPFGAA